VIELLARYFIPAWASRDGYQLGAQGKADQAELTRIDRSVQGTPLQTGNVCVYVLDPADVVIATQMVQLASKPEKLIPFLEHLIEEKRLKPRSEGAVQASRVDRRTPVRSRTDGSILLHVWTRFTGNRADYGTGQDWVELSPTEWASFAPPLESGPTTWNISRETATKVFQYFYPPGPNWRVRNSQVTSARLAATVLARTETEVAIQLRGSATLRFPFGAEETDGVLHATVTGVERWDRQRKRIRALAMVCDQADYVWHWQGKPQPEKMAIAVQLEPAASDGRR
jgi:hypothetical protein